MKKLLILSILIGTQLYAAPIIEGQEHAQPSEYYLAKKIDKDVQVSKNGTLNEKNELANSIAKDIPYYNLLKKAAKNDPQWQHFEASARIILQNLHL